MKKVNLKNKSGFNHYKIQSLIKTSGNGGITGNIFRNYIFILIMVFINTSSALGRENYYPDLSTALQTGEPDGIGPFAPVSVHDFPLGKALVYGGKSPDLFILSGRWTNLSPGIYLYKFLSRKNGVPVFAEPVYIKHPTGLSDRGVIYQNKNGEVFGIWKRIDDYKLVRFNKENQSFEPVSKDTINKSCSEIWTTMGAGQMTRFEFGNHTPGFIAGSRYGNLSFYDYGSSFEPINQRYAVDSKGILIRNKTTGANSLSYPNEQGVNSDLIVIGEGGTYYYRFTGRFDQKDQPIYADQTYLLEKNAPLSHSSLPVINTADWDGDGDIDIISGDSAGFVCLLKNDGSNKKPQFLTPKKLKASGQVIRIRPGYYGSLQGPKEANWGYTCPTVVDWNRDGLLDIVMSDSTATHKVYLNYGTAKKAQLDAAHELFCEGLDVHGPWRVKPGAGLLNGKMAYVILDEDEEFHLYWKIDNYNLKDGGKLHLENGRPIGANYRTGGKGGRVKITLFDWDRDGKNDMLLTTHSGNSIPDIKTGIPREAGAMVLLMLNKSSGEDIRFTWPKALQYKNKTLYLGEHSCSAAPFPFDNNKLGMIVTIENGRFFLLHPKDISWAPAKITK